MNAHRLVSIPLDVHEDDTPDRAKWRCEGCGQRWPQPVEADAADGCPAIAFLFDGVS